MTHRASYTAAVCGLVAVRLAAAAGPSQQISSDAGLRAAVFNNGSYQVTDLSYGWTFSGTIGQSPQNMDLCSGTGGIGSWPEVDFGYNPSCSCGMRLYQGTTVALISNTYGEAG